MNKLFIICKTQDFSLLAEDFDAVKFDVYCCLDCYDAIDLIKKEIVESKLKHSILVSCCESSVRIESVIIKYANQVAEHSIGVILCDAVEYRKTFDALQFLAMETQNYDSDIGVFALELINKTIEHVFNLRQSIVNFESQLESESRQHYWISRNQRIPIKNKFSNRTFGIQRKILRR
jgi:hypothetical protein